MVRSNNTIVNILIGIVIGFCLSFIITPPNTSSNFPKFQYIQSLIFDNNTKDRRHDAHNEEELDESNVPDSPMHFHENGSKFHRHGKINFEKKIFFRQQRFGR